MKKKMLSVFLLLALLLQLAPVLLPDTRAAVSYSDADWDALVLSYQAHLCGDEDVDWSDPLIQDIVGRTNSAGRSSSGISYNGGRYWVSLEENRDQPDRIFWSTDITAEVTSDLMRRQFEGIYYMAKAYGTKGSEYTYLDSASGNNVTLSLYQDPALREAIFYGLEKGLSFYNSTRWGEFLNSPDRGSLYNWYDFAYGSPLQILRTLLVVYPYATEEEAAIAETYTERCLYFIDKIRPNVGTTDEATYAYRRTRLNICSMIAALTRSTELMEGTRSNLADFLSEDFETDEGVKEDGSYICHHHWSLEGTYGTDVLVERLVMTYAAMSGTPFALEDAEILAKWMVEVFQPTMHKDVMMIPFNGRYPTSSESYGKNVLKGALHLVGCFEGETDLRLRQFICSMVVQDTVEETEAACGYFARTMGDVNLAQTLKEVALETVTASTEGGFANMRYISDRATQHRPDYTAAVSMSSTRIAIPESINGQNRYGWYGNDGAVYVYNDCTQYGEDQYDVSYQKYANLYRVAGTTQEDGTLRQPQSNRKEYFPGMTYSYDSATETETWTQEKNKDGVDAASFVGGVEFEGKYIAAAMDFESYSWSAEESACEVAFIDASSQKDELVERNKMKQVLVSDLTAKKSYFMFDNEIVCVGSDIDFSTRSNAVNTYVDNRELFEQTTAGGTTVYGTEDIRVDGTLLEKTDAFAEPKVYTDPTWVHQENFGGYYFPTGGQVYLNKTCRSSSDDGDDSNDDFNAYTVYVEPTDETHSFFELWLSHGSKPVDGSYSYVMLPEMTADETAAYTKAPDVRILKNTTDLHVVQETRLGITAMVFWKAGSYGEISVDRPMILMVQEKDGKYILAACDPTQKLEQATVTISRSLYADALAEEITYSGGAQTVLTVNFSGSKGKTVQGTLSVPRDASALLFDFNAHTAGKYAASVYGGPDYSRLSGWATAKTSDAASISGAMLHLPLTDQVDASGNPSGNFTYLQPSDGSENFAWSNDTSKANFLRYTPTGSDIFQIRFKLEGAVRHGDYGQGVYLTYLPKDSACWSNSTSEENAYKEILKLPIDDACLSGGSLEGKYVTLTLSLEGKKFSTAEEILGICVQFGYLREGTASIDYIYIGPRTESLYFGFDNDGGTGRYNEGAYGGYNYDDPERLCWASACTDQAGNVVEADSAEGVLNVYTGRDYYGTEDYGAYISTTALTRNYPWTGNDLRHSLSYDPSNAQILEIRFKSEGIAAIEGKQPTLLMLTNLETDGVVTSNYSSTVPFAVQNGQYQTLRIPVSESVQAADYIKSLGVRFRNTASASEGSLGKFVIDYIYVGTVEQAPSQLYFDFTATKADAERYSTRAYGDHNYDTGLWAVNPARNSLPEFSDGCMHFTIAPTADNYSATGIAPFVQTGDESGSLANGALHYIPGQEDVIQLRFAMENCAVQKGNPAVRFYFATDSSGAMGGSVTQNIDPEVLTSGQWITVTMSLSELEAYGQAEQIRSIRLNFPNVCSPEGSTGSIKIDYIYLGAGENAPAKSSLYFDFTDLPEDRLRYSSRTYAYTDFDCGSWSYSSTRLSAPEFSAGTGSLSATVLAEAQQGALYLQTGSSLHSNLPLYFSPKAAEYFQIRFKLENFKANGTPAVSLYYYENADSHSDGVDTIRNAAASSYRLTEDSLTAGTYLLLTLPVTEDFRAAENISALRLNFSGMESLDGEHLGKITVDYIYVGTEQELPTAESLYFDFSNGAADFLRYGSKTYGNVNFDLQSHWSAYGATARTAIDVQEETLVLTHDPNGSSDSMAADSSKSGTATDYPLCFPLTHSEVLQFRFRLSDLEAVEGKSPYIRIHLMRKGQSVIAPEEYFITQEDLSSGKFITVTVPVTEEMRGETVESVRVYARYLQSVSEETPGTVHMDYIYIGPEKQKPSDSFLFFDFDGGEDAQLRYGKRAYGGISFDDADEKNWWLSGTGSSIALSNGDSALQISSGNALAESSWPAIYFKTAAMGENASYPLNFDPTEAEYFQIRFKMKNFRVGDQLTTSNGVSTTKTIQPYLKLTYYETGSTAVGTATADYKAFKDYIDADAYYIATIPIKDAMRSAESISSIRVYFGGVERMDDAEGILTVDYIYVGPEAELPRRSCAVRFQNEDGTLLYSQTVWSGDSASYMGQTPTKEGNAACHYTFTGWDQPLSNIEGDTVFTAQFRPEAHSYVEGVCVCGAKAADYLCFKSATVTLESDLSMNFYVEKANLGYFTAPYAVFAKAIYDAEGNVTDYEETTVTEYAEKTAADGTECYVFSFTGISAKEMSSAVSVILSGSYEGTVYSGTPVSYSVKQYAENLLAATEDAALRTLLVDMLNYGAEAQSYFIYNTANLASADLTEEQKAWASQEELSLMSSLSINDNEEQSVYFESAALLLEEKVTMNFYLDLDEYTGTMENLYARVFFENANGDLVEYTIEGTELTELNGDHVLYFDGLNAAQMRSIIGVELYSRQTASCISQTLYYSIESYAHNKLTDSSLNPLVTAMMRYGDSVAAYAVQ